MAATLEAMSDIKVPTETVRIPGPLVRRINRIASHKEQSVPKFLAEVLEPIVDELEAKMLDEIAAERASASGSEATEKPRGRKHK